MSTSKITACNPQMDTIFIDAVCTESLLLLLNADAARCYCWMIMQQHSNFVSCLAVVSSSSRCCWFDVVFSAHSFKCMYSITDIQITSDNSGFPSTVVFLLLSTSPSQQYKNFFLRLIIFPHRDASYWESRRRGQKRAGTAGMARSQALPRNLK